jgi:DNA-binding transcriptional MerR regulator
LIYHLSDGKHGSVEISKIANVSDGTVRRYWESWARLGIVEPLSVRGGVRYKKSFQLEDFGFTVPQVKEIMKEEKHVSESNLSKKRLNHHRRHLNVGRIR